MANLNTQTFDQIVSTQATVVQGNSSQLVDYSTGSIMLAVAESVAAVALWLQGLILTLLTTVRASTSTGADLDSWVADFGVARQAATYASGAVTFGRYTATAQATIVPGTLIQSGDGTVQFQVVADTTQSAFSSALGVYVIPPGTTTISATMQCLVAGLAGNVASGVVNTLGQAIAGVDYCTNALTFTNGVAAESDTALRTRFVAFLGSLARATKAAVGYAITSLSQTYTYAITEGYLPNGTAQSGYFYVVANDGTGAPSSHTLSAMTTARVWHPVFSNRADDLDHQRRGYGGGRLGLHAFRRGHVGSSRDHGLHRQPADRRNAVLQPALSGHLRRNQRRGLGNGAAGQQCHG
jgi:hypothetical protein